MSPSAISLSELIRSARRTIRRDVMLAVAGTALLVVPIVLVLAWLFAAGSGWIAPSPGPLALEVLGVAAAAAIVVFVRRRWLEGSDERDIAATAESQAGLPAGAVLGILELGRGVPAGTSAALFEREQSAVGRHFAGRTPVEVSGTTGSRARRRRSLVLTGLIAFSALSALLGFTAPERAQSGWTPLLHPLTHLASPPLPALLIEPGDAEVLRGADLPVRVRAPGRFAVTLSWRADGDVLRQETVSILEDTAVAIVRAVDARTEYWVEAPDGARSRVFTVTPRDPLLVTDLTVVVRHPPYVGRAPDRYSTEVPPLELPEGATLIIEGRTTRDLESAFLAGETGGEVRLDTDGALFSATWMPATDGIFTWRMTAIDGSDLNAAPAPIEIMIVADMPPLVEITYPGRDTLIDPARIQAVAGDARDDYGIAQATLVSWRVSAAGRADPPVELRLPVDSGGDRVLVRGILDLRDRDVLPGDTIKYFMRVTDNSPRRQTAVSSTFSLYLPGAADLRDRVTDEAQDMVRDAQELTESTRALQEATRTLERRTEASNARRNDPASRSGGAGDPAAAQRGSLGFRESEQARQILEEQQKVMEGLEDMRQRLDAMQRAMEDAGLRDPATQQKIDELRQMYDQMMTPEARQQLDELKEALDRLDPEQLEKALEQLAEQQKNLQDKLEESLEELKRAANEQRAGALAQEARELATQQQALSESMRSRTPTEAEAQTQRELEQKARELASQVDQFGKDLESQKSAEAAEQTQRATQDVGAARQDMNRAARDARERQGQEAAQAGEQAARRLEDAAQRLDEARDQMADAAERAMREAMERATNEALSLAQRQQALQDRMEQIQQQAAAQQAAQQDSQQARQGQQQGQRGQQQQGQQQGQRGQQQQGQRGQQQGQQQQGQRGQQQGQQGEQQGEQGGGRQGGQGAADMQSLQQQQAAVQQGLEQLGRNLSQAAEQTGSMSRDVGAALGRANLSMQQTMQALQQADAQGRLPTQEAEQTVEALNRLALSLLNNQQQGQQQSGSGEQQAMEQLAQIAQQQGQLNGRSNALMPLNLRPQAMAQQLNRMAQEQRDIASRLDGVNQQLGSREDVLGRLDEFAAEAERIAREMEGGRLPADVLARQERLFHRLLDAGRTLERDETSSERVAERPGQYSPITAPALDAELIDATVPYRVPSPEELRGLPPAYRVMILEYFERINRAAGATRRQRE